MNPSPRALAALAAALTLTLALFATPASAALRYRGKQWSTPTGGTVQDRILLYPSPVDGPNIWRGTIRCRALSPWIVCLTPASALVVQFYVEGKPLFLASIGDGVCSAQGIGRPGTWLTGDYSCVTGDYGTFSLHRVGS